MAENKEKRTRENPDRFSLILNQKIQNHSKHHDDYMKVTHNKLDTF